MTLPGLASDGAVLFGAKITAAFTGFVANMYLAHVLGVVEFGKFSFVIAILSVSALLFDSGYFSSGAALIAASHDDDEKRGYLGALYVVVFLLGGIFAAVVFGLSLIVDDLFTDKVGFILSTVAISAPVMLTPLLIERSLKATGQMALLGSWNVLTRVCFLMAILWLALYSQLTALSASAAYLAAHLAGFLVVMLFTRPEFSRIAVALRAIIAGNADFGRSFYMGRLFNLLSYNSDKPLLMYFYGATSVGVYSLAMSCAGITSMWSQSIGSSQFRSFAEKRPISQRILRWNLAGIVVISAGAVAVIQVVVAFWLGPEYDPLNRLIIPAVLATAFQSAYQPYNAWLLANSFGQVFGRFLTRNAVINIAANLILIPTAGAFGAATASIVGMAAYFFQSRHHYRKQVINGGTG